jgi:hypothetical protein
MVEASRRAACDPDTLSFMHTIEIVRRNLPFYVAFLLTLPFGSP